MLDHTESNAPITQWGVESPDGDMWVYHDETVARIVAREQGKEVHTRKLIRTPWTRVIPLEKDAD